MRTHRIHSLFRLRMRPTLWILCLFWACSSPAPPPRGPDGAPGSGPPSMPGGELEGAPGGPPPPQADPWVRSPGTEPHPEARALYRRAVQLVHEGKLPEAEVLFSKITETWGDTRFAARLRTPGVSEHFLGQAAGMGVGLLAALVYAGFIDVSGKP
jgi:hypothetical protein